MNIERGPRKDRGFTILDNALVQNKKLSFGFGDKDPVASVQAAVQKLTRADI